MQNSEMQGNEARFAIERPFHRESGFTLIEMSIVLAIVGLIVGGVLVGQDLIRASEVRATISQIERYQAAVNTFRGKYGALPGDLNDTVANQFGFASRGQNPAEGDGNGLLEGVFIDGGQGYGFIEGSGETAMFWSDLTYANGQNINLIEGSYSSADPVTRPADDVNGTGLTGWFPEAKLGKGNFVYVWSDGEWSNGASLWSPTGANYFGISALDGVRDSGGGGYITGTSNLPVNIVYRIDSKLDDGLPQSGRVLAKALDPWGRGWAGSPCYGGPCLPFNTATPATATTCFDNGGVSGPQHYSMSVNGGAGPNCAISFQLR